MNKDTKSGHNSPAAMPHERDTSPEANAPRPRDSMRQASKDLKEGQVDTDLHGERGIDEAVNPGNTPAAPTSTHDRKPGDKTP